MYNFFKGRSAAVVESTWKVQWRVRQVVQAYLLEAPNCAVPLRKQGVRVLVFVSLFKGNIEGAYGIPAFSRALSKIVDFIVFGSFWVSGARGNILIRIV